MMRRTALLLGALTAAPLAARLARRIPASPSRDFDQKRAGSEKMHMLAHVAGHPGAVEGGRHRDRAGSRPTVRLSLRLRELRRRRSTTSATPSAPKKIYDWTIENPELHRGIGAMDGKYFKIGNKYYYAQSFQFMQGSPDADLGAVIFDVTGLPDPSKVKVVARIRYPASPGGFHNTFAYKHSDGRALYFATIGQSKALDLRSRRRS